MTNEHMQASCSTETDKRVMAYDLRSGVTGHRHLVAEKTPAIEAALRGVLDRIERVLVESSARPQSYAATTPATPRESIAWCGARMDAGLTAVLRRLWPAVPENPREVPPERQTPFRWVVVSPLAEGSDRIVAREVLARRPLPLDPEQTPPRLEVVLPMPLERYREDFETPQDRGEFDELFAKASWTNQDDELIPTEVEHGPPRNAAYRMAGRSVVNRCDVLIAIWNGKPAAKVGGTGDIVPYAIQQGRPVLWINSEQPEAAVTLLTKTPSSFAEPWPANGDNDPMQGAYIDEFPTRAKQISLGFHRLAALQRDPALDTALFANKLSENQSRLKSALQPFGLVQAAEAIGRTITPPTVRADMLAQRYQLLHRASVCLIYTLALAAVPVAVAQHVFWPDHHWIIALEILFLLAAWGLLRVNRRERWQEKYLNDRYLAEWLRRAQFEVLLSPASQSNSNIATKTVGGRCTATPVVGQVELYRGPETWFVDAFQQVIDHAAGKIHRDGTTTAAAIPLPTLRDALLKAWIEPQAGWHASKACNQHRKAKLGERMTFGLFAATLLFATIHLLFGHMLEGGIGNSIALLAIVLPAAAATLHSIERFFHYERTADRSEQMARQLRRLADRVRAAETEDELRQAIRGVDAMMAREVEEWWIAGNLHRPGHPV
jgi:hypothetical protein